MHVHVCIQCPAHTFLEGLEVPSKDGGVYVRERLHGGESDVVSAEEGQEPGVHLIPPTSSLGREA